MKSANTPMNISSTEQDFHILPREYCCSITVSWCWPSAKNLAVLCTVQLPCSPTWFSCCLPTLLLEEDCRSKASKDLSCLCRGHTGHQHRIGKRRWYQTKYLFALQQYPNSNASWDLFWFLSNRKCADKWEYNWKKVCPIFNFLNFLCAPFPKVQKGLWYLLIL